jgi:hypothetical protein
MSSKAYLIDINLTSPLSPGAPSSIVPVAMTARSGGMQTSRADPTDLFLEVCAIKLNKFNGLDGPADLQTFFFATRTKSR